MGSLEATGWFFSVFAHRSDTPLSTPASLSHLQDLVTEPVQSWDALICSSTAGRSVVESVLSCREQAFSERSGGNADRLRSLRPQLPVIPLPLPDSAMSVSGIDKQKARAALGLHEASPVVLWLGRLSVSTKLDPWPTYAILERVARRLKHPLVLLECGPDDGPSHSSSLNALRECCPNVQYKRLGGADPVSEQIKHQALSSADVAVSLVDNTQETFGLAVAEAMAAGLPVVASNWNGYRDLVRHGVDGYLVPSRWASMAPAASAQLGWQQFAGIESFPAVAGALAQLVQLDGDAAEKALFSLLTNFSLRQRMGRFALTRAKELFAEHVVMNQYEELFAELEQRRLSAPLESRQGRPMPATLDPVRAFHAYPSHQSQPPVGLRQDVLLSDRLPKALCEAREPLWELINRSIPNHLKADLYWDLLRKHSFLS